MKFDKTKSDIKNLEILKNEIIKTKVPYSKILAETLFSATDSDKLRGIIRERVTEYIDKKIKK